MMRVLGIKVRKVMIQDWIATAVVVRDRTVDWMMDRIGWRMMVERIVEVCAADPRAIREMPKTHSAVRKRSAPGITLSFLKTTRACGWLGAIS
ncbi:MAG: hypothetical protein DCC68_11835 [Planctomycetota bacterium]|nr:MAG: hypothetical protein DCC68_11835 [Planctomycetota bacterium]